MEYKIKDIKEDKKKEFDLEIRYYRDAKKQIALSIDGNTVIYFRPDGEVSIYKKYLNELGFKIKIKK